VSALYDTQLEQAYARALDGDRDAGRFVMVYLSNALNSTGDAVFSATARRILGEMVYAIVQGADPREATFSQCLAGNRRWKYHARNLQLILAMEAHLSAKDKPSASAAARKIEASGKFKDDKGNPLQWKTIRNTWAKYRDDVQARLTFGIRKLPE
jgi:hypothetical protein